MEHLKFHAYGHPNIQGLHKNTFEFTQDSKLSLKGDCIIGVRSDFDSQAIQKFIKGLSQIKMTLETGNLKEEIIFKVNPDFNSSDELVVRLGTFESDRTLGLCASKSAKMINREIIELMKHAKQKMVIKIEKANK